MSDRRLELVDLVNEMVAALNAKLYLVALTTAVTLPDVCASLASANGATTKDDYKLWVEQNILGVFSQLSSEDVYQLRCKVLHNSRVLNIRDGFSRVVFTLPGGAIFTSNNRDASGLYMTDVGQFCYTIGDAAMKWLAAHRDDQHVVANMDQLVRYRDHVPGSISGLRVIA